MAKCIEKKVPVHFEGSPRRITWIKAEKLDALGTQPLPPGAVEQNIASPSQMAPQDVRLPQDTAVSTHQNVAPVLITDVQTPSGATLVPPHYPHSHRVAPLHTREQIPAGTPPVAIHNPHSYRVP